MLHKLVMPAYRPQLEAILDFQQQLLDFACQASTLPLKPDMLKKDFGEQKGDWLSKRCWRGKTDNNFYKELANLISYVTRNPVEGPAIVAAFSHDREFYKYLDDPDFEFHYPRLSPEAKEAIKPLMVSFYENLLTLGFPNYIHLNGSEDFTRKLLLKEFYEANPRLRVCPGCDGAPPYISNRTRGIDVKDEYQDEAEVDHFFPKASYPFFAVHFMNLVPLCEICNTKAKRDQDPLNKGTGKGVLRHTFLPFCKAAAQSIEVTIFNNANNAPKVVIKNRPGLATVEQVENLNNIFKLNTRWEHHLESWIGDIVVDIRGAQARRKGNRQRIEREIKSRLRSLARAQEDSIGQMTHLLVQRGYANYALNDQQELDLLIKQIMDDNTPKRRRF